MSMPSVAWIMGILFRYRLAPLPCSGELRETIAELWEEVSLQPMYAGIGQRMSRMSAVARSEGANVPASKYVK